MFFVDLSIPIAILALAIVLVLGLHAWARVERKRIERRTRALVATIVGRPPAARPDPSMDATRAEGPSRRDA